MSAMAKSAATMPEPKVPIMAAFMSSLPGSYHRAEENTPATKAAPTKIRIGKA